MSENFKSVLEIRRENMKQQKLRKDQFSSSNLSSSMPLSATQGTRTLRIKLKIVSECLNCLLSINANIKTLKSFVESMNCHLLLIVNFQIPILAKHLWRWINILS